MNLRWTTLVVLCVAVFGLSGWARAQEAQEPAETSTEEPAVAVQDTRPPSPPPGPEIMHPTQHGFKFTPRMIDLFADKPLREVNGDMGLQPEQHDKLRGAIAKRLTEAQRRYGQHAAGAFEFLIETAIEANGQMDADSARKLAERIKPALPMVPFVIDGLLEDARPILNDKQFETLSKKMHEGSEGFKKFEQRVDRWAKGEVTKGTTFNQLFNEDDTPDTRPAGDDKPEPVKSEAMLAAETQARAAMQEIGPEMWPLFLSRAKQVFGFTDEQFKAGEKLVRQYTDKAKAVMTPEWKQQVRINRLKAHAEKLAGKEPIEPWMYHLNGEYAELTRPLKELGRAFRHDVAALATDEQRAKLLAQLQKFGTDHGMAADDMNERMLHLAASRPANP